MTAERVTGTFLCEILPLFKYHCSRRWGSTQGRERSLETYNSENPPVGEVVLLKYYNSRTDYLYHLWRKSTPQGKILSYINSHNCRTRYQRITGENPIPEGMVS